MILDWTSLGSISHLIISHNLVNYFHHDFCFADIVCFIVIVNFPLDEDPNVSVIAWTTTPWTLPSNLALCVNPNMDYVKIKHAKDGQVYIMMEARLPQLFKKNNEYKVLDK